MLGVSRSSAYRGVGSGDIPSMRVGRRILVPTTHLLRMLGIHHPDDTDALTER